MENKILRWKSPEWYYHPRTLPDGTDFSKWECKYHMFTMTVVYLKRVSGEENQTPYVAEIRMPGGTVILKDLLHQGRIGMEAKHMTTRLTSVGPFGFATKHEAKKYCIDLVNLYLILMGNLPLIEEDSLLYEHFLVPVTEETGNSPRNPEEGTDGQ